MTRIRNKRPPSKIKIAYVSDPDFHLVNNHGQAMEHDIQFRSRIFYVERLKYETTTRRKVVRDVVRHPGSVAVLPLLDHDRICLIRNHRVSVSECLLEIPAGTLEPPELPLACARRELIEETGYRASTFQPLTEFYPAPGILDEKMHLFLASDLQSGAPAREAGEEIENEIVSFDRAMSMIQSGEIHDAKTMLALLLFDKHHRQENER